MAQRAVLEALECSNTNGVGVDDVLAWMHPDGDLPTARAAVESIRRAIRTLGGRGLVRVHHGVFGHLVAIRIDAKC